MDQESETNAENAKQIASIEDLLGVVDPLTADGHEVWYRGHRDATWQLTPSAFRDDSHRKNEQAMIDRFRQQAAVSGLGHSFDDWGWITFAQHHAVPTRLLDWTESPLIALFFACENNPGSTDVDAEFITLDPCALNKEAGDGGAGSPLLLRDSATELDGYRPGEDVGIGGLPRAVIAPMVFDRIRFQGGCFTIQQSRNPTAGEEQLRQAKSTQSFIVPATAKRRLRDQLDALGFNEVSVYRDLDRIARRIKDGHGRGNK